METVTKSKQNKYNHVSLGKKVKNISTFFLFIEMKKQGFSVGLARFIDVG